MTIESKDLNKIFDAMELLCEDPKFVANKLMKEFDKKHKTTRPTVPNRVPCNPIVYKYLMQDPVKFAEKICFGDTDGDVVIPAGRELTEADLTPAITYPEQYWIDLEDVNLDDVGPLKLD